ncbi:MAG: hypothetical protein L7U51_04665, partial [Planktomarina temperata]|nr:hypothetical protein [Planktomarina temperata]
AFLIIVLAVIFRTFLRQISQSFIVLACLATSHLERCLHERLANRLPSGEDSYLQKKIRVLDEICAHLNRA